MAHRQDAPDSTRALREQLKKDRAAKQVRDAAYYTRWLVDKDPALGWIQARRVVYRELRQVPS